MMSLEQMIDPLTAPKKEEQERPYHTAASKSKRDRLKQKGGDKCPLPT